MIEIKASAKQRAQYVDNIVSVFESATPEELAEGVAWYGVAHRIADMMCDGDIRQGAGLLAALSPQTEWWLNVRIACDAYDSGEATGHLGDALSKATRIMAGVDPADVLPMQRKTGHFYRLILDPSDPTAVCIDRHAHDVAVGRRFGTEARGLDAHSRYELIAECYRVAARRLKVAPSTVQAVTWVVWRNR